ncbi:MAG: acyl-CoA dehydrogenase [Shewanellaceae bacterium]|nr:acyl-CoA dehydrogenase [Shewanellaceae bacterium]
MLTLLALLIIAVVVVFAVQSIRMQLISQPAFKFFKRVLPPLSSTEKEAIEAGDVWWEGELFQGKPDWQKLHGIPACQLTADEQSFIDKQVPTLLGLLDDYDMMQKGHQISDQAWDYIKKEGFFAFIIGKEFGGHDFSAYAISTIVSMVASRSISAAVTIMVPNSLGPGELLSHYGTDAQKERWLSALAKGDEVPCFALTGPEAGSDAGSIPDFGVVCHDKYQGKKVLGIRLTWEKRYITLAPVASVVGLAFKLHDPDNLLGHDQVELGITCALVPASHPGVEIGRRHNPLNMSFMNGTTSGTDVFIPIDWIIGGVDYAGKGWRMLMECLSSGRGISLPALASASGHLATRTTTAYVGVRKQFGMTIGNFEGIKEALARLVSNTYQLEASRRLTASGVDLELRPAIVSAISKYQMTELARKIINDSMDIHGGKAIQLGPKNYIAQAYMGIPVAITVEGANILTRSLMIFGQGAFRCHPYVLSEIAATSNRDEKQGLQEFDSLLTAHIVYAIKNAGRGFLAALTSSAFNPSMRTVGLSRYYQHCGRFSAVLAWLTDLSMLMLGGELKRREMFSARLGDILSQLYMASSVFKMFDNDGCQKEDLPMVNYTLQWRLYEMGQAVEGVLDNFPNRLLGRLCRLIIFPFGNHFKRPSDKLVHEVVKSVSSPTNLRERICYLCPNLKDDGSGIAEVERAFMAMHAMKDIDKSLTMARRSGVINKRLKLDEQLEQAVAENVLSEAEANTVRETARLCRIATDVDDFKTL